MIATGQNVIGPQLQGISIRSGCHHENVYLFCSLL